MQTAFWLDMCRVSQNAHRKIRVKLLMKQVPLVESIYIMPVECELEHASGLIC